MAEHVDDLTIAYAEGDQELTRELDKVVLSRGLWTTVMFLYQDRDRRTGEFGPPKVSIRRYKKIGGTYRPQSRFNVSSRRQAQRIVETLQNWLDRMA